MSAKQEKPKTYWLQHGSFRTIVVENDKANPDWGSKPFQVIEIFALEQAQTTITALTDRLREAEEVIAKIAANTYGTELANSDEENNEILAGHFFRHQNFARAYLSKHKGKV